MLGWSSSPTSRARLASVVRPRYRSSSAARGAMAPLLISASLGLQIATLAVTVAISNSNWRHRGRRAKELVMNTLSMSREQTAGTMVGPSDRPTYAVVGFDGSAPSLRALDTAARLLNDRPGGMEIVYVAHVPAVAAAGLVGAASAALLQSFDDNTRELSEQVRERLQASHLRAAAQRWHFQRR